jgi:multicomponent Na+:H+ antiporter subunit G
MSVVASVLVLAGAAVAVVAGIGLLRFSTPYARFHAAGKASPVAFLVVAAGAAVETGWPGAARMAVASAAMVLTLPVGVHLLFRAVHRTTDGSHLVTDELAPAERRARERRADGR